jgi:nucleotide-binding universal stress UspA family protein
VRAAAALAKRLDARLVGLAPTGLIDLPRGAEKAAPLAAYAALARDRLRDAAESASASFHDACRAAGIEQGVFVIEEDDVVRAAIRHSHFSDLTVLTQGCASTTARNGAGDIVMGSPHPTLILPASHSLADTLGVRALVAWDDSRESMRALTDALPLLRRASRVDVVAWREPGTQHDDTLGQRLDRLQDWLARQGVHAQAHLQTTDTPIATAMLACASEFEADLLVMGAYGHARWTERVLGGATQGVLERMRLPVLLAH